MKIEKPVSRQSLPDNAKKVFEGEIFDVYQWEQEMFDGSTKIFEKIKRTNNSVVLALTNDGKVIVLDQQQPGKGRYLSLPGGMVDNDEDVYDCAKRELLEETGYESESMELWHSATLNKKIDWRIHFFIAKGCEKVSEQNLDCGGEKIEVNLVEFDEFLEMIFAQKIKSSEFIMKFLKEDLLVIDKEKTFKKIKEYFN